MLTQRGSIITIKSLRCRITLHINIFPKKHLLYGQQNYFHIQPKRAMIHIPRIQLKLFCPRNVVTPIHLCPSRDSRTNLMSAELFFRVQRKVFRKQRSWPHKCHIPFQHIYQLWQFIYGKRTNYFPDTCQTNTIRCLLYTSPSPRDP